MAKEELDATTAENMAVMLNGMWTDKKHGANVRALAKEIFGDKVSIPDVEVRQALDVERQSFRTEVDAFKKERDTERAQRDRNALRMALLRHGARQDELDLIEKFMNERLILDPEGAVVTYRAVNRVAAPSGGPHILTVPHEGVSKFFAMSDGSKGLSGSRDQQDRWARERATKDIDDIVNGRPLDPSPMDPQTQRRTPIYSFT